MTQYIDKAAVVAEITKRISERVEEIKIGDSKTRPIDGSVSVELVSLLHFLDTLEAKEVDIEQEIKDFEQDCQKSGVKWNNDIDYIARYFFELGFNAQNK